MRQVQCDEKSCYLAPPSQLQTGGGLGSSCFMTGGGDSYLIPISGSNTKIKSRKGRQIGSGRTRRVKKGKTGIRRKSRKSKQISEKLQVGRGRRKQRRVRRKCVK